MNDEHCNDLAEALIEQVLNSDEVREAELIHALIKHEMGDHQIYRLKDILDEHLFYYQETPRWQHIVDALIDAYAFRSARLVTLAVDDQNLSLRLCARCFARMLNMGVHPHPSRLLN